MAAETGLEVKVRCGFSPLQPKQAVLPAVWPTQRPSDPSDPVLSHSFTSCTILREWRREGENCGETAHAFLIHTTRISSKKGHENRPGPGAVAHLVYI